MFNGAILVGASERQGGAPFFAIDPSTGAKGEVAFHNASAADVADACALADTAFESFSTLTPDARAAFLENKVRMADQSRLKRIYGSEVSPMTSAFKKEMEFEYAFVNAGGTLLAGEDPTGIGGVLAGFGDQREVELLVEAGFTPLEAIRIATMNGAQFLGEGDRIGTIAPGKAADLVVIKGDPSQKIEDIENTEIVFKNGIGYDPARLLDSVRGIAGSR